jgi:hypothetical protein
MVFSVLLHTFSDCHFEDVYIKFRKYEVRNGVFPQKIVIFAFSIQVALEAFSKNLEILRIVLIMYTVF